jgi:hypothetical protein
MSFDGLLGPGSAARQLLVYGVGYEIARSLLGPMFTQIEYLINEGSPLVELSPPELADLVIRGVIGNESEAAARAVKFGIDPGKFHEMTLLAGEPPGLVQVLEWWRRGYLQWDNGIGSASVAEAIRTSRIYSYWTETIQQAQFVPPSPIDAVNAMVRNQLSRSEALALAYFGGLGVGPLSPPIGANMNDTANAFDILVNTRGNPPAPGELLELANRGEIPWGNLDPATKVADPTEISFAQGIYEGDSKDKWLPYLAKLGIYIPPPRSIPALLKSGAITVAQATTFLEHQGLSPDLAAAYVTEATHAKTTKAKQLSESHVVQLYTDKLIDEPTAVADLELLGYNAAEAAQILTTATAEQTLQDYRKAISRISGYYIAHRLSDAQASTALASLGVPADQIASYLSQWQVDRTANVRILSNSQIESAWEYGILTQDEALMELQLLGYTPYDAWVLLSIKAKGPLPNPPPQGPGPIQ